MAKCDQCGNEYNQPMEISLGGSTYTFDSFECAIHKLAPQCAHCSVQIIGHGTEVNGKLFCCHHCAEQQDTTN